MPDNDSEAKRTLLVTGGSRGIGASVAMLAARRGYDVCLTYRARQTDAERVAEAIQQIGRQALVVQADLASESDLVALWRTAIERFETINVLVNNAGLLRQQMDLAEFTFERLREVFDANVLGTILCTREAVRHMSTRSGGKGGAIINVSSAAARLGSPHEYIDYAASKAAIDAMTIGLSKEVGREGIRVNSVRAGTTETEIHASGGEPDRVARIAKVTPLGRGAKPIEIAEAILWLASDQATFATGAVLDVAGGV